MITVHQEPDSFQHDPPELCTICKKPTRTWTSDGHTPLCQDCAKKQPRPRKLKVFNGGDWEHRGGGLYVCAYSWADACELINEARRLTKGCTGTFTVSYMRKYWNAGCWGSSMQARVPVPERGVWHITDRYGVNEKIVRLL